MRFYKLSFLLLAITSQLVSSEPNFTIDLLPAEVRDKQLTSRKVFEGARKIFQQANSTGNVALLEKATLRYREVLDMAKNDSQSVSPGILLASNASLGTLYAQEYARKRDQKSLDEAENFLSAAALTNPSSDVDAAYALQACAMLAGLKASSGKAPDAVQFFTRVLDLAASYPSLAEDEGNRYQINIAKLFSTMFLYGTDRDKAIRYYQDARAYFKEHRPSGSAEARGADAYLDMSTRFLRAQGYQG